jgi:hypothetical protein
MSGAQSRLKQTYGFLTGKVTGEGLERKGGGEERTGSRHAKRPLGVRRGGWDGI